MSDEVWKEHIASWLQYLEDYGEQAQNRGDKIKILRQLTTLQRVRYGAVLNPSLFLEFIDPDIATLSFGDCKDFFLNLNDAQKMAVMNSLGDNALSLIQGPPGTGKTQVIAEICLQLYRKDPNVRILVCSETHTAVNNLVCRIAEYNDSIRILRLRDKERDRFVDEYSPENIIRSYLSWAEKGIENYDAFRIISEELNGKNDRSLEKELALSANVVGMTCNRVSAYDFRSTEEMFDYAIIDEVCKATLPEILSPMLVCKKAILLGDPKQLPPVFCSEERDVIRRIENCRVDKIMYIDRVFEKTVNISRLDTQYRMAESIGTMISNVFYEGLLKNGRHDNQQGYIQWVDYIPTTAWPADADRENPQIYNLDECRIIASMLNTILNDNHSASIGVITPYRAQVAYLRKYCPQSDAICIDTVDAFQGKECDTIIFSAVRTFGTFRFLADVRRLNVALSRAKNELIFVGNLEYCSNSAVIKRVIQYCNIKKWSFV